MTDEQILQLVKEHFEEDCDVLQYFANFDAFMKFARAIYDEGYTKGFKVGHDAGWELNDEVSHRGL
jgi:hypothetical protein